jgi:hypothetical protein
VEHGGLPAHDGGVGKQFFEGLDRRALPAIALTQQVEPLSLQIEGDESLSPILVMKLLRLRTEPGSVSAVGANVGRYKLR